MGPFDSDVKSEGPCLAQNAHHSCTPLLTINMYLLSYVFFQRVFTKWERQKPTSGKCKPIARIFFLGGRHFFPGGSQKKGSWRYKKKKHQTPPPDYSEQEFWLTQESQLWAWVGSCRRTLLWKHKCNTSMTQTPGVQMYAGRVDLI